MLCIYHTRLNQPLLPFILLQAPLAPRFRGPKIEHFGAYLIFPYFFAWLHSAYYFFNIFLFHSSNSKIFQSHFTRHIISHLEFFVTIRNEVAKVMFLQVCVCPQGGVPDQVWPPRSRHPLGTRYTPQARCTPWEQTPSPQYSPRDQVHTPLEPGTPPDQVHPLHQVHHPWDEVSPTRYTPRTRYPPGSRYTPLPWSRFIPPGQVHHPSRPGTPPGTRCSP